MKEKEKLIKKVLNETKDSIIKTRDGHQEMIKDYQENGFGNVHPGNIEGMKEGLNYTHGYTIGHLCLLEKINNLLDMSVDEIKSLIKKNDEIEKQNKEYMDNLLKGIKDKYKNK